MNYFIHNNGLCESKSIGNGTRVWAFSHILPGAEVGDDCNICDHVFIENDVKVGNRVTIKSGVQLWDGICIEDDVFIGPNVTFTNDIFPRSKIYPDRFLKTKIRKGASIGANATILPGIEIGENAMIGAGSVVTKNIPSYAIAFGNPAVVKSYVGVKNTAPVFEDTNIGYTKSSTPINGVEIYYFKKIIDPRGSLSVGEFQKGIPFIPKRYFLVFDVPNAELRGEHAHKKCHQFLICINGSCSVLADDGNDKTEINLNSKNLGLYLPPMIWGVQYKYSKDAILLVFASHYYDETDYIRNYNDFLSLKIVL